MKVYAVITYDGYYPMPDNVVKVFRSKEKADEFSQKYALDSSFDFTEVVEYDVGMMNES